MAGEEFPDNVDDIEKGKGMKQANELDKASTSTSQPKEIIFRTDEELRNELYEAFHKNKLYKEEVRSDRSRVKIQRAPEIMLRSKELEEYYKPMELSIGPLHAKDPKLFKEELKLKLAAKFIKYHIGESADTLLQRIKDEIGQLRTLFDTQVIASYSDDSLARLLLLDGCAMLQFIHSYVQRQSLNEFGINSGQAALIQQDLFLLENQIPSAVVNMLISSKNRKYNLSILEFVLMNNVMAPVDSIRLSDLDIDKAVNDYKRGDFCHLLDLLRAIVVDVDNHNTNSPYYISAPFLFVASKLGSLTAQLSFRNVQELKAAGITLKPSESCSLNAVSFHTQLFFRGQTSSLSCGRFNQKPLNYLVL